MVDPGPPLFEREGEVARIEAALAGATTGGRVLLFEGPPGVGTSALLRLLRARAVERGYTVLTAQGVELEAAHPFGVVRQLFEPALAAMPAADTPLAGPASPAREVLDPGWGPRPTPAETTPYHVLHGLYWLTVNLAQGAPVALVIDDLQWADVASLRWLAYLRVRIEGLAVVLAAATRPRQGDQGHDAAAFVAASSAADVVRPAPLTIDGSTRLVRQLLDAGADDSVGAACHEVTNGNRFLLRELVEELKVRAIAPLASTVWVVRSLGPRRLADLTAGRFPGLTPAARQLAEAVAVLGRAEDLALAAEVADMTAADAARAADRLGEAGVVHRDLPLRFVHPIVGSAVSEDLPPGRRSDLHRRAAEALRLRGVAPDRMAAHLLAAPSAADPRVVEDLGSAAADALQRGAPDIAVRLLRRALQEPPAPDRRPAVLSQLGLAEARSLDPSARRHLEEALAATADPAAQATLAGALSLLFLTEGRTDEAVRVVDRVLPMQRATDPEGAERLEVEMLTAARLSRGQSSLVAERLRRLAERPPTGGPADLLVDAQRAYAALLRGSSAVDTADLALRALASGGLLSQVGCESPTFYLAVWTLVVCDYFDPAVVALDQAVEQARRRGSASGFALASCFRGDLELRRGRLADAEAELRGAVEAAPVEQWPGGGPLLAALLAETLMAGGRLDEAGVLLGRVPPEQAIDDVVLAHPLLHATGWWHLKHNRAQDAAQAFAEGLRRSSALGVRTPATWPWRSSAALALRASGQAGQARDLADEELALARQVGAARPLGIALRVRGLLAAGDEQLEYLEEAASILALSPAALERGWTLVELGAAQRRGGARRTARSALQDGLAEAARCGAWPLVEQARTELAALGVRTRPVLAQGADALTPSERRIARLAAAGSSNREIAGALFLNHKTVEWHLGQVYRKLDIRSRSQLIDALD